MWNELCGGYETTPANTCALSTDTCQVGRVRAPSRKPIATVEINRNVSELRSGQSILQRLAPLRPHDRGSFWSWGAVFHTGTAPPVTIPTCPLSCLPSFSCL